MLWEMRRVKGHACGSPPPPPRPPPSPPRPPLPPAIPPSTTSFFLPSPYGEENTSSPLHPPPPSSYSSALHLSPLLHYHYHRFYINKGMILLPVLHILSLFASVLYFLPASFYLGLRYLYLSIFSFPFLPSFLYLGLNFSFSFFFPPLFSWLRLYFICYPFIFFFYLVSVISFLSIFVFSNVSFISIFLLLYIFSFSCFRGYTRFPSVKTFSFSFIWVFGISFFSIFLFVHLILRLPVPLLFFLLEQFSFSPVLYFFFQYFFFSLTPSPLLYFS